MTPKTLFIGLDGATFDLLDPLMNEGVMPYLKSFIEGGVRADLRTIVPPLTPPAWTSLLTGRSPGQHGVFDFFQMAEPGSKQIRLTTSKDVRCQTVAEIVNRQRLHANILNFPAHFPPPAIDGAVIAGWMPWRQMRLGCHPEDLYDRLKELPGFNPRGLMMDMALEASATEGASEDEYQAWVETHARREENWLEVVRYITTTQPASLTAILLDGPDKVQHLCWRFLDPKLVDNLTAEERTIRNSCLDYYRRLDRVLAEIVSIFGPETTTVIASDHGFGATTEVFYVNTWLAHAGYLTWTDAALTAENSSGILGMHRLTRHTEWLDWSGTLAYAATPTSNGIHIVMADQNDGIGVSNEEYLQFRAKLIDGLRQFSDPQTGESIVTQVQTREELFAGAATEYAPDLTLTLRDGGLVSILPSKIPLAPRPRPAGTHRPLGIFTARGPGIRAGTQVAELSILDVAPMLLYSLGLGVPEDLEGRVPLEIYEPAFFAKRRVEFTPTKEGPFSGRQSSSDQSKSEMSAPGSGYNEEAEAAIVERLRALGYIE